MNDETKFFHNNLSWFDAGLLALLTIVIFAMLNITGLSLSQLADTAAQMFWAAVSFTR